MHIFDGDRRFMGGYGIVGGNLPIAAGLALASDYKGTDEVTVCMFGDGASEHRQLRRDDEPRGALEAAGRLPRREQPLRYGDAVERHSAVTDLSQKAEGLGVPASGSTDGRGRDARVRRRAPAARARGSPPTLVEAFTYRYRGHSAADPEVYREKEEVEEWRKGTRSEIFGERLVAAGVIAEDESSSDPRARSSARSSRRSSSPTPRPSRRSTGSTTTSTCSGTRQGWYAVDERTPDAFARRARARAAGERRAKGSHEAGGAAYGAPSALRRRIRRSAGRRDASRRRGRGGRSDRLRADGEGARTLGSADGDDADARGAPRRAARRRCAATSPSS